MLSLRQQVAMILATASLVASAGCAQKNDKAADYIPFPNLTQVGLRKVWERQIAVANGEHINNAWRVGDSVYLTTDQSRIVRVVATSGVKAWDTIVGSEASTFHKPVELAGGKEILLMDRGNFFVLNKETGRLMHSSSIGFLATTTPVVIDTTICVGGNDYFHGLFLDQLGGQRWVTFAAQDSFVSDPAVIADSLAIASRNGKLWRISATDGNWIWKDRKTNGEVVAGLATDTHAVFVPSLDHYLYGFDATTGGELWNQRLDGQLDQTPVVTKLAGGEVLVPASGKGLYAVSPADGTVRWEADGVTQIASVNGDYVWAGDSSDNLRCMRVDTGEIVSSTPLTQPQTFVYSPDNWVIILNKSGVLDGFQPNR
ncbi:MAG: outer membrane protein assembly factor BamB family protein [Phycisphaerae bacterium]